jgi:DNA mismatch repair protein MutS2
MLRATGAALGAARVVAAELKRLAPTAPRTAALLVALPPKEIESRLKSSLGPDGAVLDGASKELARARKAVREARERLVTRLESILHGLDPQDRAPDAAVTVRGGRYVIPIRSTARARVGGIVHDESATRATMFVEPPEVIELGNELRAREAAEQREVLRVLRELTELLRPHRDAIAAAWDMCVSFDDLCARARYAVAVNGFAPEVGGEPLSIRQGRHPLLISPLAGTSPPVPFDLELAPDEWTVLVSGPNTGGKTVLIKAVGLLSLMAQSGIVPPLGSGSRLPVFDSVFADIGDRQSIAANLSTFSAHVAVLRDILAHARAGSLVLLDEIGSGTDPAEGAALAGAVLRALTRRRAVALATTHLGALKRLAAETVGIVNASLQFDAETMTPTYRFLKGVPGRSYGLAIARRLGVDPAVTAEAERALPDVERALDALLADVERRARDLETHKSEVDAAAQALAQERERMDSRAGDVAEREQALRAKERTLEAEARAQARAYLLEARKTVEAALAQARAAVDEATAKEARKIVEQAIDRTESGKVGKGERWLSLEELRRQRGGLTPSAASNFPTVQPSTTVSEISLRGLRADEAQAVLERALDQAVLADLPYLRIVHGKGTGTLRQLVHQLLERDPRVKRFGFAPANQGGHGVTVAELG